MNLEEVQHIKISKKKPNYKPSASLLQYLENYDRMLKLSLSYSDLVRMFHIEPVLDKNGKETYWFRAFYTHEDQKDLHYELKKVYSLLKSGGDSAVHEHLEIKSIEYCSFGNSNPFRIKIVNNYNDVYDYFYIKKSDASRIYGLELEHILSPSRINYFANAHTLIEEHIVGIPGDIFVKEYLETFTFNRKRLAKEFIKFNERCICRLLGDMRSYNFVVDMTYDFDDIQFKIRAIDFDQQTYEGNYKLYLPQFFKENNSFVNLVIQNMNKDVILQYRKEERSQMARRIKNSKKRLFNLYNSLKDSPISTNEKVEQLKKGLATHYESDEFLKAKTMEDLVKISLAKILNEV